MDRAGGKWNSILGGEQGGASGGADWLAGLEGLMGELRVPGVRRTGREESQQEQGAWGPQGSWL